MEGLKSDHKAHSNHPRRVGIARVRRFDRCHGSDIDAQIMSAPHKKLAVQRQYSARLARCADLFAQCPSRDGLGSTALGELFMSNLRIFAVAILLSTSAAQISAQVPSSSNAIGTAEYATIGAINRARAIDGRLRSIIALDPTAIAQARAVDQRGLTGPLAGQPILIKDNIETAGTLPTTAGSIALRNNVTGRDAPWSLGCAAPARSSSAKPI